MVRLAITGASGFIGRHVLAHLTRGATDPVIVLGRRPLNVTGAEWRPWSFDSNEAETAHLLEGVHTLCHLAAYLPADMRDLDQAEACWRANAWATCALLQAAKRAGVRQFVLMSGANILSAAGGGIVDELATFGCEHAPAYLGSKLMAEVFTNAARGTELAVAILRPSAVYGPGMAPHSAIPRFIERLSRGEAAKVENTVYRADFVWVDDVADVLVQLARSGFDGTINIGSGVATSLIEVARTICRLLAQPESLIEVGSSSITPVSVGFPAINIARARAEFGFQPTSLEFGLSQLLRASR